MDKYIILLITCIIISLFYIYYNKKIENYTSTVVNKVDLNNKTSCSIPFTNNKKDTFTNNKIPEYKYSDNILMSSDEYLGIISKLLNDLSNKTINVSDIPLDSLTEKEFIEDSEYITKFIDLKINNLIKNKTYLQQNGSRKYEYLYTRDPEIYYYGVKGQEYNLFKVIYTIANPHRTSYTTCIAFITQLKDKLEIQNTTFLNDFSEKHIDKLNTISKGSLKFDALDTLASYDFDKYGNTTLESGINYISNDKTEEKIEVIADIPDEYKDPDFTPHYLPSLIKNQFN